MDTQRHLHHHLPRGRAIWTRTKETIVGFQTDKAVQAFAACPTAASAWRKRPARTTAMKWTRRSWNFLQHHRKTHNAGVFDAYTPGNAGLPLQPYHHRPAGRLRPGPHHRRLPPCGAVRRGPADRGQAAPEGHHPRHHVFRRHPRAGGAQRADPRAGGA